MEVGENMSQNKKNKKFNKFLNYIYEPYNNQKLTISRALHFTKFYALMVLIIEVIVCTILKLKVTQYSSNLVN